MKLRNKKTGEILNGLGSFIIQNPNRINCEAITKYDSLAELNEEWEDVPEEPKGLWSISGDATIEHYDRLNENDHCKEIGNYFETEKEAEKAVEKLKAWKRLKDKGFSFNGWNGTETGSNIYYTNEDYYDGCIDDMDLLFGGEE